jgi:hypothetical protein
VNIPHTASCEDNMTDTPVDDSTLKPSSDMCAWEYGVLSDIVLGFVATAVWLVFLICAVSRLGAQL